MAGWREILVVAMLGLLTTSASIAGAALGLYVPLSRRVLACVLAFAAGALISALAIELAIEGAQELHQHGFSANAAWSFISGGFAVGAVIYYATSLFLDQKGAGDSLSEPLLRIRAGSQAQGRGGEDQVTRQM